MYGLCMILDRILNPLILALAAGEFLLFAFNIYKLEALRRKTDRINNNVTGKTREVGIRGKRHSTKREVVTERDWDEFDALCSQYQKDGQWYSAYSLIIQLFTLLGILGTVAGLYIAMQGNQDWSSAEGMFEGVRFALSSTVLGICCAVFYKVGDIFLTARYIDYIDNGIELFRGNYYEEKNYGQTP